MLPCAHRREIPRRAWNDGGRGDGVNVGVGAIGEVSDLVFAVSSDDVIAEVFSKKRLIQGV